MRILVTGATGFVGRWLIRELQAEGHEPISMPPHSEVDIADVPAVARVVADLRPDAIAHLAGVSYARDAARDPDHALAVNEGGTRAVMEAAASRRIPVLVSGSSEVYGTPAPEDLPLHEGAPLRADQPYGRSKLAQERAALELGAERTVPVVVTRSFNHTGPGQRLEFVAPALAARLLRAREAGDTSIAVGNLDVRRDIGDVRDIVRAYRLLLERLSDGAVPSGTVVNVATGRAVSIREVFDVLASEIGGPRDPIVDPALVRQGDPPLVVADVRKIRAMTGWSAEIPLRTTLGDLARSLEGP